MGLWGKPDPKGYSVDTDITQLIVRQEGNLRYSLTFRGVPTGVLCLPECNGISCSVYPGGTTRPYGMYCISPSLWFFN